MKMRNIWLILVAFVLACGPQEHTVNAVRSADTACDAGVDAGDAGCAPVPRAYMILRDGQSDSLEQAIWGPGVSLYPWTVPPNVSYWHINSARTISVTTFGPLGGKFGTELSDGKALAATGLPVFMSTVAISSTRCVAALPGNPGYNNALHLAVAAMIAALPPGPFPVPLTEVWDNGTSDAQASSESQAAYYSCLTAHDADISSLPGMAGRRYRIILHRISVGPSVPPSSVPSLGRVQAAEDQFCSTRSDCVEEDTAPYAKQADGYHYTDATDVALGSVDASDAVATP